MRGQDKPLLDYDGIPMIDRVRASGPNVPLLISANRHLEAYQTRGAVFTDQEVNTCAETPLNGILGGLERASTEWLLVSPGDTPELPAGWWKALRLAVVRGSDGAVVHDGLRQQHLHLLLRTTLAPSLRQFLQAGHYEVWRFLQLSQIKRAHVPHPEWFINVNTEQELR
jgi:molybdopterin-guanine dinucleotide biosynthesis protein A